MKRGVIKIFGDIGGQVNLVDIIAQVKELGDVSEYVVFINSPGGFVSLGYDIYNYLRGLGKKVTTIIDKECASIATVIALAGDKGSRLIIAGSQFMIHNPWTMEMGDATKLADTAEQLQEVEDELIKFYSKNIGVPVEGIRPLMRAETFLSAEESVKIGFTDRAITQDEANQLGAVVSEKSALKAFAKYELKNTNMSKETKEVKSLMDDFKAYLKTAMANLSGKAKALDVTTDAGDTLTIDDPDGDGVPMVGDGVMVGGKPVPDATYTLSDGTVIVTDKDSKIATVTPPAADKAAEAAAKKKAEEERAAKESEELKALKEENKKKDEEIAALKKAQETTLSAVGKMNEKFEALARNIKSEHTPEEEETHFRKGSGETVVKADAVAEGIKAFKAQGKKK